MSSKKTLDDLCEIYGLIDVERICYNDLPTNKLKANVLDLKYYVDIIERGVYLELTSRKHSVIPNINHARTCKKCGSITHKELECNVKQRCLRCTSEDHQINACVSKEFRCVNCHGQHMSSSDMCNKLAEKTLSMNEYVLDILVGEGLIRSKYEILKSYKQNENRLTHPTQELETIRGRLVNES